MGVGTSHGAFYDDEFQHQAGIPKLPKGDEEMVKKPGVDTGDDNVLPPDEGNYDQPTQGLTRVFITKPDVEDRRAERRTDTLKEDGSVNWEGIPAAARDIAVSAGNYLWGQPVIEEAPVSDLSRSLGHEDIKIEKNVGRSLLQRGLEDIQGGLNLFGVAKGKAWGDSLTEEGGFSSGKALDRLLGLNGVERYKLWPERMLEDLSKTAGDVSAGKIPMWAMTPDGEFHTSIEGLESAHKLMPSANSVPVTIQLRGAGLAALEQYHEAPYETGAHDQFLQLLNQVRRQPNNIGPESPRINEYIREGEGGRLEHVHEILPPEFEQTPFDGPPAFETSTPTAGRYIPEHLRGQHPDQMSDQDFLTYGEYQHSGTMTHAQETRWHRLNDAEAVQVNDYGRARAEMYPEPADTNPGGIPRQYSDVVTEKIKEAMKSDSISLIKDERRSYAGNTEFKFASSSGVGKLDVHTRRGGKDLYVDLVGKVDSRGFVDWEASQSFGLKEFRPIVKLLMDEYPKIETISGFRVSGARKISGSGEAPATIRLPGRGKKPVIKPSEED